MIQSRETCEVSLLMEICFNFLFICKVLAIGCTYIVRLDPLLLDADLLRFGVRAYFLSVL